MYDDIWSAIPIPRTALASSHNFTVCAKFDSTRALDLQDGFVVDALSFYGPNRGG